MNRYEIPTNKQFDGHLMKLIIEILMNRTPGTNLPHLAEGLFLEDNVQRHIYLLIKTLSEKTMRVQKRSILIFPILNNSIL